MRRIKDARFWAILLLASVVILTGACRPRPPAWQSPTPSLVAVSSTPVLPSPTLAKPAASSTSTKFTLPAEPPGLPTPSETSESIQSIETQTPSSPSPTFSPLSPTPTHTASGELPYPGPNQPIEPGPTSESYPGLESGTYPYPGQAGGIFSAGGQVNPTLAPTLTQQFSQFPTATLVQQPTPAAVPGGGSSAAFLPKEIPPGGLSPTISIWHSLGRPQLGVLEEVIRVFQDTYPQVSFILTSFPQDELRRSYESAFYQGKAPDLVIGPSDWGAALFDQALVADLAGYYGADFWQTIPGPALAAGQYRKAQVGLPFAMYGVVLFRNRRIISQAPASYDGLVQTARQATHGGVVGAFFDLSAYYTMAHLVGLGGSWLDDSGQPTFGSHEFLLALRWLDLLKSFRQAGAVEMNTSRDVSLFQQGKVGFIIDGTWNMTRLAQALGPENLAIDPWPAYGTGRLAGFVQTYSLYLNASTAAHPDAELVSALQFMGTLLSPPAQRRLSEVGYIPALKNLQPADPLIRQAHLALQAGVAYPPALQGEIRVAYWTAIDTAIRQALSLDHAPLATPLEALQIAFQAIARRLTELKR